MLAEDVTRIYPIGSETTSLSPRVASQAGLVRSKPVTEETRWNGWQ